MLLLFVCALLDYAKQLEASGGQHVAVAQRAAHAVCKVNAQIETVREKDNQFDGWTFAKYLNGPENTRNYRNFAYARPGQALTMKRGFDPDSLIAKALAALLTADPEAQHAMGVTWARESGNCYVCSRTLTTPESIEAGIGPVCAGK